MNAFFSHGEAEYFLARRDGRVVGRITAQVNHAFNEYQKKNWGWFGFLEFEDDQEVLDALLAAAERWLRGAAASAWSGPADFAMNDESGMLIEGFELRPMIVQPWHPPYYQQRMEQAGMTKAMDLLMWNLEVTDRDKVLPGDLRAGREGPVRARDPRTADAPPAAAQRHGRLRRGLQLGLVEQLGLRALLEEGPRRLRPGAAARLRQALVHDRRARRHRRGGRHGDHGPRHQPGAGEDEGQVAARSAGGTSCARARHRPRARRLPRRQARVPAHRRRRQALLEHFNAAERTPAEGRRDGLDPRDQHRHEPRHGSDGRASRQALPRL